MRDLENGGGRVVVDGDDLAGLIHPGSVLNRAGYATGDV